ncbi:MAG: SDR family NAD(P)-dependent oxidoreductase [Gemmatimonadetes bacterium]|nr:SDR family NAD(P)-dependent oxidoreductase [Gemmatimonadota bacterium]
MAFVTGASSGLGRGLAVRLAQEGYAVGVAARRWQRLEEVVGDIQDYGGRAQAFECDVSDPDQIRRAVGECRLALGPIELLVANAGVGARSDLQSFSADEVDAVFRTNFMGAVVAAESVLPEMLRRRSGHLVAVSSVAGFGGLPGRAAYSASKAAMTTFFESLRLDLHDSGVAVTVIHPGFVRTEMTGRDGRRRPFIMDVDGAVDRMMAAIEARRPSLMFPKRLAAWPWMARVLPRTMYDFLARRT